jgi:hypothetical protein
LLITKQSDKFCSGEHGDGLVYYFLMLLVRLIGDRGKPVGIGHHPILKTGSRNGIPQHFSR